MSEDPFFVKLGHLAATGEIPARLQQILTEFYESYKVALQADGFSISQYKELFSTFLDLVKEQIRAPYAFQPFHQQIRHPFDYYTFGVEFLRPLVDMRTSTTLGLSHIKTISQQLSRKENVILLANHQIEGDPQAISILLDKHFPHIAAEMIFVAGERVITDPVAIPFSMGRNLLCIYSKRYIDHPPEDKLKKQMHNKRTMELMSQLLKEGGKCIYVAPSGGRDRRNAHGEIEIAPFDPQSIEMFYLMAQKSSHPAHFYPLALMTYDLLPPPQTIQIELGESRVTKRGAIHLEFGKEIDMEHFPGSDHPDKHERRKNRADFIWNMVKEQYQHFKGAST